MPKKKTEEEVVETATNDEATASAEAGTEETALEAQQAEVGEENAAAETETPAVEASAETDQENAPADDQEKGGEQKAEATAGAGETSIVDSVFETAAKAVEAVAETISSGVSTVVSAVTGSGSEEEVKQISKRAERIGIVFSDKMTKTVTVRVERQVKHPIYRKYIKRRKKFMAHDELGAAIGDKVRIIETRPLSAKKRWRVVEIIQKAEK